MNKTKTPKSLSKAHKSHRPTLESVVDGLFADHVTWMATPSSVVLLILAYAIMSFAESHPPTEWAYPLALWIPPATFHLLFATAFLILDHVTMEEGKRFKTRSRVAIGKMIVVVLRNLFFSVASGIMITRQATPNVTTNGDSMLWMGFSIFVQSFIFEVMFWTGHFFEHVSPKLYKSVHLLHHTTKADVGFSGYYMTLLDFCLESLFPLWVCQAAAIRWNLSTVALLQTNLLHFIYAPVLHSGWQVPGFPDPLQHWLHHVRIAPKGKGVNYGTHFDLLDRILRTNADEAEAEKVK